MNLFLPKGNVISKIKSKTYLGETIINHIEINHVMH